MLNGFIKSKYGINVNLLKFGTLAYWYSEQVISSFFENGSIRLASGKITFTTDSAYTGSKTQCNFILNVERVMVNKKNEIYFLGTSGFVNLQNYKYRYPCYDFTFIYNISNKKIYISANYYTFIGSNSNSQAGTSYIYYDSAGYDESDISIAVYC